MPSDRSFGHAWIALSLAIGLHVLDEALTGFLDVYNPTILALRARYPNFPAPVFTFEVWLGGLISGVLLLLALSPLAYRHNRVIRIAGGAIAALMVLNAAGHTAATLAGRTVESVPVHGIMPGFYSSPLLLAASLYLLVVVRRTAAQPLTG